jgi:hypothetical protein
MTASSWSTAAGSCTKPRITLPTIPFPPTRQGGRRPSHPPHPCGGRHCLVRRPGAREPQPGRPCRKEGHRGVHRRQRQQSVLTAETAIARARQAAAPIYTIAQGSALRDSGLLDQLARISKSTGGLPFAIHEPAEILHVFDSVSRDLTHGYLFTFQPPADQSGGWHKIKVTLSAPRGRTVRAREGYSLE